MAETKGIFQGAANGQQHSTKAWCRCFYHIAVWALAHCRIHFFNPVCFCVVVSILIELKNLKDSQHFEVMHLIWNTSFEAPTEHFVLQFTVLPILLKSRSSHKRVLLFVTWLFELHCEEHCVCSVWHVIGSLWNFQPLVALWSKCLMRQEKHCVGYAHWASVSNVECLFTRKLRELLNLSLTCVRTKSRNFVTCTKTENWPFNEEGNIFYKKKKQ